MISPARVSFARFGGLVAVALVTALALVVLAVPTPGHAAAIGIRDTEICVEKCRDRAAVDAERCHVVTIQPVGFVWNTSVSQPTTNDPREDPIDACLLKVEGGLAECIEDCDSRSRPHAGRDGGLRNPFSARRR
jgi:hypothetical protein